MNRSAKAGARSSLHYGGEGVLTHPAYQGVCGRHGAEDMDVTQGGLGGSFGEGPERAGTISVSEVSGYARQVVGGWRST
jgi:hypothetical protein